MLISTISDNIFSEILGVISINFSNCPGFVSGFFYFAKKLNFFIKSVDKLSYMIYNIHVR
nr:MAG TPA: hypothetical protein [Caudoviricetes sp.]